MHDIPTEYCEQLLALGWEPINTVSNIAFMVAGVLAFYTVRGSSGWLKYILPALLFLIGVGSGLWHFGHSPIGDTADTAFIVLFAGVVGWVILRQLFATKVMSLVVFLAVAGIALVAERSPMLNGSLPYVVLWAGLMFSGVFYIKKFPATRRLFLGSIVIFGLAILFR